MLNFFGFISKDKKHKKNISKIYKHYSKIKKENNYLDKNIYLLNYKLKITDLTKYKDEYIILYSGVLYNKNELKKLLQKNNFFLNEETDEEIILLLYIIFKEKMLNYLNGIFSIVIYEKSSNRFFLARDPLGIKSLFYTLSSKNYKFIFSSSLKRILQYSKFKREIDEESLIELFNINSFYIYGKTYFKDIFELKAGSFAYYENGVFSQKEYYTFHIKKIDLDKNKIINNIKKIAENNSKNIINLDKNICIKKENDLISNTFLEFLKSKYKDIPSYTVDYVKKYKITFNNNYEKENNINVLIDNIYLFDKIKKIINTLAIPFFADTSVSTIGLYDTIKRNNFDAIISNDFFNPLNFIFLNDNIIDLKFNLINKELINEKEIQTYKENYIKNIFTNLSTKNLNKKEINIAKNIYLNLMHYISIISSNTTKIANEFEIEVINQYFDINLFNYIINILFTLNTQSGIQNIENEYKNDIYKNLIQEIFSYNISNFLINKNSFNLKLNYSNDYISLLENKLLDIINDSNSKLNKVIDKNFLKKIIICHGENLYYNDINPLISYPEFLAHLIQIDMWIEEYNIKFNFKN